MNWKPNKWYAATLAFLFPSMAMLYVNRPFFACGYLLAFILMAISEFWLIATGPDVAATLMPLVFSIFAVVHAFRLAVTASGTTARRWWTRWYGLLAAAGSFALGIALFRAFAYEPFRLPAGSMFPSMPPGSYVVVKKFGYGNYSTYGIQFIRKAITALIVRGDVVVFEFPPDRKISYVKRVIGLPEDHIEYKNKRVYLNGAAVTTSSIHKNSPLEILQEKTYQIAIDCSRASQDFDIRVKLGHLFVLGDNRDNSNDSRQWGQVPYDHVIGKVVLTLAPSDETPFALGWQRSAGCEEK